MLRASLFASSIVIVAACGPSRARPASGPTEGTGSAGGTGTGSAAGTGAGSAAGTGAGSAADQQAAGAVGCPAAYADVHAGTACADTTAACSYAEGHCWCGPRSYCGGVAPTREMLADLARPAWQCKPVRTDGCPEAEPSGACDHPGQVCSYGDCCFTQLTCQNGAWTETGGGCPP